MTWSVAGRSLAVGAARGVVAAMAMTAMRRITVGLGIVKLPPPEEVAAHGVPALFGRVPETFRDEAIELAHWAYGAAAGSAFALLPGSLRARAAVGPLYGVAIWAVYERGVSPLLGLREPHERNMAERAATIADHALYGAIVGGARG